MGMGKVTYKSHLLVKIQHEIELKFRESDSTVVESNFPPTWKKKIIKNVLLITNLPSVLAGNKITYHDLRDTHSYEP